MKPIWYYNKVRAIQTPILVDTRVISDGNRTSQNTITGYESDIAIKMDLAYQALQAGFIPNRQQEITDLQSNTVISLADNYRFVNYHFGRYKSLYVLMVRLLSLKNPFAELQAFLSTIKQRKLPTLKKKAYSDFSSFESPLVYSRPLVSVIIPTLNRYLYLKDVLSDLERQSYSHFEVIIFDQSDEVKYNFYENWNLDIKLFHQKERALWLARNNAINNAKGDFIALTEDDVRLPEDWLKNHLRCVDYFNTNISCGTFYGIGKQPEESFKYFKLSEIFATGNTLLSKDVFRRTGLFDRQFEGQRMGDGEFGLRCLLSGEILVLNPQAYCIDVKAPQGGLREMGSWDALRSSNLFAPRPVPSVLYYIRKYFGKEAALLYIIQNAPFYFIPYKMKKSKILKIIFMLLMPLLLPLIALTTYKSWLASSQKLKQGPLIYNII